ncbi:hypothetical protein MMC19_006892 [Ptychographa xylographoides]|nr:hypothetical protein [Ptychographa xylographoides]
MEAKRDIQQADRPIQRLSSVPESISEQTEGEVEKSRITMDEKTGVSEAVVEVPLSQSRSWMQRPRLQSTRSYLRSQTYKDSYWQGWAALIKLGKFMGPGALISVAYIDPDNYQTAISAGAMFGYKLLFIVLVSNLIAIYLQALSVKLGSVTGMDLAQMNRAHLPRWLNISLYILAEAAIICTDIGQVIGTAIAINILIPQIPLVAGCALTIADTLFILLFYRPDGSMKALRAFELFVAAFVLGVFICFCIELSLISKQYVGPIFDGFLPSSTIVQSQGLYQSCAILGGTLMPHTIYLGSGLCQARMRDFDVKSNRYRESPVSSNASTISFYRPSLCAIKSCMSYSIAELCLTLAIIAIFVNSAILIVAAASLTPDAGDADLPGMYALFVSTISQGAGTIFALALLFSGITAGIVATMAGQLVCEGAMNWRMSPFLRRLVTRSIAIIPGIIIAGATGQAGLADALNGCNVVLSVVLIFITAPLIWYTSRKKYMTVAVDEDERVEPLEGVEAPVEVRGDVQGQPAVEARGTVSFANNWATTIAAVLIWIVVTFMNIATLVFLGLGVGGD